MRWSGDGAGSRGVSRPVGTGRGVDAAGADDGLVGIVLHNLIGQAVGLVEAVGDVDHADAHLVHACQMGGREAGTGQVGSEAMPYAGSEP